MTNKGYYKIKYNVLKFSASNLSTDKISFELKTNESTIINTIYNQSELRWIEKSFIIEIDLLETNKVDLIVTFLRTNSSFIQANTHLGFDNLEIYYLGPVTKSKFNFWFNN